MEDQEMPEEINADTASDAEAELEDLRMQIEELQNEVASLNALLAEQQ